MIDIAKHIRIFNSSPDDDFVTKRSDAIKDIDVAYKKKKGIDEIMKLSNDLAIGLQNPNDLDSTIADVVEKAIKKQSTSFIAEGEELQILCCAVTAALRYLDGAKPATSKRLSSPDILGISLWSALSFQVEMSEKPKLEALRSELIEVSKKVVEFNSFTSRNRLVVPEWKKLQVPEDGSLAAFAATIDTAIIDTLESAKTNAILDREEIDLLWWTLNDWSEIAEKKLSGLNQVQRAILGGIEISKILMRLPSKAHNLLALRTVDNNISYTGNEIIQELGNLIPLLVEHLKSNTSISTFKAVFPLCSVIIAGADGMNGYDIKRPLSEWSGRALLEGTMINFSKFISND
jgi:hypothetical protein